MTWNFPPVSHSHRDGSFAPFATHPLPVSKHVAKIPGALLLYMMESTPDTLVSCCPRALAYMVLERERGLRLQKGLPGSSEWRGELGHGESTGLGRKGNGGSQCSLRQGLLNAGPLLS